jgi:hypothetical protein
LTERSSTLRELGKSVLLGGALGGFLSIVPLVSLLNVFFMFWIVVGAGVSMNRLTRLNGRLSPGDALLAGSLSGLVSGALPAMVGSFFILQLDTERLITALERVRLLAPDVAEQMMELIRGGRIRALLLLSLGAFVLMAIVVGGLSALVWRLIIRPGKTTDE